MVSKEVKSNYNENGSSCSKMTIPNINIIVAEIEKYFKTTLKPVRGTRIFFEGNLSNKKKFILCSPKSKLHQKVMGGLT